LNKYYYRKYWKIKKRYQYFKSIIFGFLLWLLISSVIILAWLSFDKFKEYRFRGLKVRVPDAVIVSNYIISINDLIVWMDRNHKILFGEKYYKSYDKNEFLRKNKKYERVFLYIDTECNMNEVFELTKFLQKNGHSNFISIARPVVFW